LGFATTGASDAELKQQAEARLGQVLRDKWRLDRLLGLGGMAAVYSATHRNGKQAAIKILHEQAALIPDIRARFLREGYLANKVHHPGALSILDDDIDTDGTVFLVMELLHGETLESRWTREKTLPWQEVCVVVDKMLDVLVSAHAKSIVHRDLKPGNIFIEARGGVTILDFGIARLEEITAVPIDAPRDTALGTPGFMPPEQARGQWKQVDARSDVWAVGATAFAVLAGRYVHDEPTINEQLLAAMSEPAPPLREVNPEIPEELATVVDRALAFDKAERWPDARAMQRALRQAYETITRQPFSTAPPPLVPGTAQYKSVRPDAPTLAASELEGPKHGLSSTARPVSAPPGEPSTTRTLITRPLWVGIALVAIAVGAAALLIRPAADAASTRASVSDGHEFPEPPRASAVTTANDEQGMPENAPAKGATTALETNDAAPSTAKTEAVSPPRSRSRPPAAKRKVSDAESSDVDIFSRRK
jgi:serine/threonine protein kinase